MARATTGLNNKSRGTKRYWLLKSEPEVFSIDDLRTAEQQTACWDGVRNYQARNSIRDDMKVGDLILFYHSNANPPGVAGIASVVREAYPDPTAFDATHEHYDPKSDPQKPTWYMVDVQFVEKFSQLLTLSQLRACDALSQMVVLQRGSRLSVQPVSAEHFKAVLKLAKSAKSAMR